MENKTKRDKMPVADRAKQFMPFAAVVGLEEALEQKRREIMRKPRAMLSEDMQGALNDKLSKLIKGDRITIRYYCLGEYMTQSGKVQHIDAAERRIKLSGMYISFVDIVSIEKMEQEQERKKMDER